jgi:amino acid adenylation domain-containing protein
MVFLLHHLLTESAEKYSGKAAVVFGEERITYQELNETTDRLANALLKQGVQRGDRVAIYLNKSLQSVLCLFGILKTGAAYIPLDPNAPAARLCYILKNAGVHCLLTSTKKYGTVKQLLDGGSGIETVIVTDQRAGIEEIPGVTTVSWSRVREQPIGTIVNKAIETDLAYILYTSGSTGVPKGVMISHLNALTFINWCHDEFGITAADRISSHAPLHFDLSIFDIFTSIKSGATIYPVPEEYSIFPKRLIGFIRDTGITVWYSVPSILVHMMVHGNLKNYSFPDIRTILFAGEVFPAKYLRELMTIIPGATYCNLYGPTETNVCTYYNVREVEPDRTKAIPIGKACRNIEIFALDEQGRVVAETGREGELYVRGSCVAMGYWDDVKKTESAFIRNFLASHHDEKMYRTGDIVMLDENGDYHLIGRRDHMIKSRGYRIELGEIESALYGHENIKEAVVVAVPDDLITNRLKAFVVFLDPNATSKLDLEKYLSSRVPHYMMPETIDIQDSLPKTSTGKIDRSTLAAVSR